MSSNVEFIIVHINLSIITYIHIVFYGISINSYNFTSFSFDLNFALFSSFCTSDGRVSHNLRPRYNGLLYTFVMPVKVFFNFTFVLLLNSICGLSTSILCIHLLFMCIILNRFLFLCRVSFSILYLTCSPSISTRLSGTLQYSILRMALFCNLSTF